MTSGVEVVLEVLESAGFERLPRPLVVAGSAFEFDAAASGTGVSHDLVVVASMPPSSRRLVRLLSGLSRTLDQVDSRRPVTLVLLGDALDRATIADLERYARVLTIETHKPQSADVREAVAVLLPLVLPSTASRGRDPLAEVAIALGNDISAEHQVLIDAAEGGPDEVREALRRYIDDAIGMQSNGADT